MGRIWTKNLTGVRVASGNSVIPQTAYEVSKLSIKSWTARAFVDLSLQSESGKHVRSTTAAHEPHRPHLTKKNLDGKSLG